MSLSQHINGPRVSNVTIKSKLSEDEILLRPQNRRLFMILYLVQFVPHFTHANPNSNPSADRFGRNLLRMLLPLRRGPNEVQSDSSVQKVP